MRRQKNEKMGVSCDLMENSIERGQELDMSEECQACLDKIVRSNRDVILLFILRERPMCGYDLIKEIFSRYNVFLSQGTVYPILYSLEEEGVLRAEFNKGNMRSKSYSITTEGKRFTEEKFEGFIKALEYSLSLFRR